MRVALFYLSPNPYGGWVTFTAHLHTALRKAGAETELFKVGANTERKARDFGYGIQYRNLNIADAVAKAGSGHLLIAALGKKFLSAGTALLRAGARIVIHDPTELWPEVREELGRSPHAPIVIRKANAHTLEGAKFIPHPYERAPLERAKRRLLAVSTSRIDFDKNTTMILDANRTLPPRKRVRIYGFENRIYTRFKVVPHYPEWEQSKASYQRGRYTAVGLLRQARFMVDMSVIKGDGGGTQYTTLEAWDAGTVPIIHREWLRPGDAMVEGRNCYAVGTSEELSDLLHDAIWGALPGEGAMRAAGYTQLERDHAPGVVGARYLKEIA